jgi:glutathione S-transferase
LLAFEKSIQTLSGQFSIGDKFSVADLFLIPQIYNAIRNDITLTEFPILDRIYKTALEMPSCLKSHPDNYKPI